MTKKAATPTEATPLGETESQAVTIASDWEQVVQLWADKSNMRPLANRLQHELQRVGITSVEQLANTRVQLIAAAARAALQADAQALQTAAHKFMEGKT